MKAKLDDLEIYSLSMKLGEFVWSIVVKWDFFARDTVGKQWVRAIDSVSANISEGYGKHSYVEMRKFVYIARGSMSEHITWMTKADNRNLISFEDNVNIISSSRNLYVKINNYLKYLDNLISNNNNTTTVNNRITIV